MKNTLYRMLFVLCLVAGFSCSQDTATEDTGAATTETDAAAEDTTSANSDVPESLQHH